MPIIRVAGQVHLLGWEGKRVSLWENIHSNGKDYSRLWTSWYDFPQDVQEEDFIEVEGELSTKIGKYTTKAGEEKTVVEHHLQNAVIKLKRTKAEQDSSASLYSEEAPF
jgi:hypothetical protein